MDKIGLGFQESIFLFVLFLFWLCCKACRILVPQSGIEPVCLALKVQCLNHWTAREVSGLELLSEGSGEPREGSELDPDVI